MSRKLSEERISKSINKNSKSAFDSIVFTTVSATNYFDIKKRTIKNHKKIIKK